MVDRLTAGALVLRPYADADLADLMASFADPEIARWNRGPADEAGAREFMARRNDWSAQDHRSWAVEVEGRLAGAVSLHHVELDQQSAELGYWVAPWARGRGVATTAVGAAAGYGYERLDLVRVYLYHAVENLGSCGVARAAGFAHEGTLRRSFRYGDGVLHDEHLHARLVTD